MTVHFIFMIEGEAYPLYFFKWNLATAFSYFASLGKVEHFLLCSEQSGPPCTARLVVATKLLPPTLFLKYEKI